MKGSYKLFAVLFASLMMLSACGPSSPGPAPSAPQQSQPPVVAPVSPGQSQAPHVEAPKDIRANPSRIEYLDTVQMARLITARKGTVQTGKEINVPVITWGGDVATIYGNGGLATQPGSVFAREGLSVKLFREDNFVQAVNKVVSGETPYLRGTMDMVVSALEALKDREIEMVVVYQMTWSTGGDTIVVRSDQVTSPADLRGKTIGIQRHGPHMLYLETVLKDAGLSLSDVRIRWLRELTIPPYDTGGVAVDPMTAMQRDSGLAAVTVISPDMSALTSGGKTGTGAESSVKGAAMLLSTKTAGHVIADVYAVRKDYFDAHKDEVQKFVHALMVAQEELEDLVQNKQQRQGEHNVLMQLAAEILRDSPQATEDIEGLLADATFVGYPGNVQFFTGQGTLRKFETLTQEAQSALVGFGLVARAVPLAQAGWDYAQLAQGLRNTAGVVVPPRRDPARVEQFVQERGASRTGILFEFEVFFQPNQNEFSVASYQQEFDRVLGLASRYPGAIVIVEGHADPVRYNELRKQRAQDTILAQTKQAAKNLSLQRAIAVRESVIALARAQGLTLDPSQFTVSGAGIDRPKHQDPQTEDQWRANMRVAFQIVQVEAELERFSTPSGRN